MKYCVAFQEEERDILKIALLFHIMPLRTRTNESALGLIQFGGLLPGVIQLHHSLYPLIQAVRGYADTRDRPGHQIAKVNHLPHYLKFFIPE